MGRDNRIWAAFIALALAWGTSFLFIKIALQTIEPFTLVAIRLFIGWVGLLIILLFRNEGLPRQWLVWRQLAILGLINTAIPFLLITWAESGDSGIDSAVASVLNSMVPLFSILISGLILRDEEITLGRVLGLLVGFVGVILMVGRGFDGQRGSLWAHLAVIGAALMYATAGAYARHHFHSQSPVVVAAGQLIMADFFVILPAFFFRTPDAQVFSPLTIGALLWLGLFGTCFAYILYFYVLRNWGATRTTMVTYLLPIVGVTAGVIILGEAIDWRLITGGGLILSGIGIVNWRPNRPRFETRRII